MRLAALALVAGCSFSHGMLPGQTSGDDGGADSTGAQDDAPVDGRLQGLDASTVTPLLVHDFENDLIGPFTSYYVMANDAVNQSSSIAHGGTKSALCTTASPADGQATLYYNFSTRAQLYARMWIRLAAGFPPADYVMIMAFVDDPAGTAWNNIAQVSIFPNMRIGIFNNATVQEYMGTTALMPNRWHEIEVLVKVSPTAGRLLLAIDGNVEFDATNINTGSLQFHRILTGIAWMGAAGDAATLYVDDVRLE